MDYEASKLITAPLVPVVMQGKSILSKNEVRELKYKMPTIKVNQNTEKMKEIESKLSERELRSVNHHNFDLNHAMNCKKGSFDSLRHGEIKRFEATLLNKVCNDVEVEPPVAEKSFEIR